jgi:hypothetical protein
MLFWK